MVSCNLSSNVGHFQIHVEQLSKFIGDGEVRSDKSKEWSSVELRTVDVFKQFKDCLNSALEFVGEGTACRANMLSILEGLDLLSSDEYTDLSIFKEDLKIIAKDVDGQIPSFQLKSLISSQQVASSSFRPDDHSILVDPINTSLSAVIPQGIFSTSSRSEVLMQISTHGSTSLSSSPVERKANDDRKEPLITPTFPILSATTSSTSSVETVVLSYLNNLKMNLNSWKEMIVGSKDEVSLSRILGIIQAITRELELVKKLVEPKSVVVAGSASPILPDLIVEDIKPQRKAKTEDELVYMCLKQMQNYFADHENFDDKYLGEDAKRLISDISYLKVILNKFETQVMGQIEAINQAKSGERAVASSGSK